MAPGPGHLSTLCQQPVPIVPGRHLRSTGRDDLDFPRVNLATGDGRLPTPVLHPATLGLTISGILILLCLLSNVISKPSAF